MQQTSESKFENALDELRFEGFIHAVSTVILSKSGNLETVWDITNRVYDRWNPPTDWVQAGGNENLALSA